MLLIALLFSCRVAFSGSFDSERYTEVEINLLKATPEEFKNDRIALKTHFFNFHTTFPAYVENSGIKPSKHYYLKVNPVTLPVFFEKKDDNDNLIPTLKKGKAVMLYGKIKKFRTVPEIKVMPRYYLELEHFEVLENEPEAKSGADDVDNGKKRGRHRPRPWR